MTGNIQWKTKNKEWVKREIGGIISVLFSFNLVSVCVSAGNV